MKLIDADALRERLEYFGSEGLGNLPGALSGAIIGTTQGCIDILDAAPSIDCAADNPHGLVPSKCLTCGEELVPYPCMDLAQDSYRDGILYGQEHPDTTMKETT